MKKIYIVQVVENEEHVYVCKQLICPLYSPSLPDKDQTIQVCMMSILSATITSISS